MADLTPNRLGCSRALLLTYPGAALTRSPVTQQLLVYDAARDLALVVVGTHDRGNSLAFVLRYCHGRAVQEK
jgi:hypothetical protein